MKKDIKNEYKKILASLLAVSTIISFTGCAKKNKETKPFYQTYEIESGDTLYGISKDNYGSYDFVDELVVYNNIDNPDFIKAGDTIKLPNMNNDIVTYKIKFGDTFYDICKNYYGRYDHETIDRLAKYNGISKPGEVQAGTIILIPSYEILEQIEIDYTRKLG